MRPSNLERFVALGALLLIGSAGLPAWAQEDLVPEYVPEDVEVTAETPERVSPWDYVLRIGLGASFGASHNVIGNTDGNSWTIGLQLDGAANYFQGPHELRNSLSVTESFTRTPVIDEFVKTGDDLDYESIYLYHIPPAPWFGPFARFRLATSIFAGQDVRAEIVSWLIARQDGTVDTVTADRLDLTDPFSPLALKEAVGVFFHPETGEPFQAEVLVGFGAREVFADNQLAVSDDDATAEIEVVELENFVQAGSELVASFWGVLAEGRMAWEASAEFMTPFINDLNEGDDRSAFELTNIDLMAGLSLRIVEWASVEYELRAVREPQLLDTFQVQNTLLLTIGYTFVEASGEVEATE